MPVDHGEGKDKGAPFPLALRFNPDLTPVHLHKAPGDDQAEARSLIPHQERGLESHEGLKQLCLILWPDPDAGVLYAYFHEISGWFRVHG